MLPFVAFNTDILSSVVNAIWKLLLLLDPHSMCVCCGKMYINLIKPCYTLTIPKTHVCIYLLYPFKSQDMHTILPVYLFFCLKTCSPYTGNKVKKRYDSCMSEGSLIFVLPIYITITTKKHSDIHFCSNSINTAVCSDILRLHKVVNICHTIPHIIFCIHSIAQVSYLNVISAVTVKINMMWQDHTDMSVLISDHVSLYISKTHLYCLSKPNPKQNLNCNPSLWSVENKIKY